MLVDLVRDIRSKVRHSDPLSRDPLDWIMELPVLGEAYGEFLEEER